MLAPFLLYWQANAPVTDFASTLSNPSVNASYYAPLIGELHALGVGYGARPARIEVVRHCRPLGGAICSAARDDRARLGAPAGHLPQRSLLRRSKAAHSRALPRVARAERDLLRCAARMLRSTTRPAGGTAWCAAGRPTYLHEVWHSRALASVRCARRDAASQPTGHAERVGSDSLTLYAPRAGTYTCASASRPIGRSPVAAAAWPTRLAGWTEIQAQQPGQLQVVIHFSLGRMFSQAPRCG